MHACVCACAWEVSNCPNLGVGEETSIFLQVTIISGIAGAHSGEEEGTELLALNVINSEHRYLQHNTHTVPPPSRAQAGVVYLAQALVPQQMSDSRDLLLVVGKHTHLVWSQPPTYQQLDLQPHSLLLHWYPRDGSHLLSDLQGLMVVVVGW